MTISNLWKQLKKRLRLRKRWLALGTLLLLLGAAAAVWGVQSGRDASGSGLTGGQEDKDYMRAMGRSLIAGIPDDARTTEVLEKIKTSGTGREVFVEKRYVCGEEIERLGMMEPDSIVKLKREHPEWSIDLNESGSVRFTQSVEDLSPKCKDNAYFGLDKNGNLSLFEGLPEQERVIRTFFQLNVEHLKSSLPEDTVNQLYTGIRISDLADYNSVLSTFSEYAVGAVEPVSGSATK